MTRKKAAKEYYNIFLSTAQNCKKLGLWTPDEAMLYVLLSKKINNNTIFKFQKVNNFYNLYTSDPKNKLFIDRLIDKYSKG